MKIKYEFEQYPRRKGTCPKCEYKGVFRYFMNSNTGDRFPSEFGRCERINSCGYINRPNETKNYDYTPVVNSSLTREIKEQKYVESSTLLDSINFFYSTNFFYFIKSVFTESKVKRAIESYYLGGTSNGETIFWTIDQNKKIINGKSIRYTLNGKRDKHKQIQHLFTRKNGYGQSLFGLHLIAKSEKTICIVESEKTAVIASIQYPQFIWLASGSANGLTKEKIKPLSNRNIILIPDCDKAGRESFKKAIPKLEMNGNKVRFYDLNPILNNGTDLADLILLENS